MSHLSELLTHPAFRRNPPVILARIALWGAHCAFGVPALARFRRWNGRLFLPARWRGGGSTTAYLFREYYERELLLLELLLGPGMTFVDGGANTGVYTLVAARLVGPTGRVLAFEPGQTCLAALQQTIAINEFTQVIVRPEALADRPYKARLYHHHGQENSFGLSPSVDPGLSFDEIEAVTLDQALADERIFSVDLIKLDVEGAQELALRGSDSILSRCKPTVLLEIDGPATRRLDLDPRGAPILLIERGYHLFFLDAAHRLQSVTDLDHTRRILFAIHPSGPHRQVIEDALVPSQPIHW